MGNNYSLLLGKDKEEKVKRVVEDLGFEHFTSGLFRDRYKPTDKDFPLYKKLAEVYARGLNRRRADFEQKILALSRLRSYLHTLGSFVDFENFLNDFNNFNQLGNEEAYNSAKEFNERKGGPRGLWISGKPGTGKSHLLWSIARDLIDRRVNSDLSTLPPEHLLLCPTYDGKRNHGFSEREYSQDFPEIRVKNYLFGKKLPQEGFRLTAEDKKLILLDDVYEKESEEVIGFLTRIFSENAPGRVVVTSNFSLNEWIGRMSNGRSTGGLERRLRSFIKEVFTNPRH